MGNKIIGKSREVSFKYIFEDKVYFMRDNKIRTGVIAGRTFENRHEKSFFITYKIHEDGEGLNRYTTVSENSLFNTRQELIDVL